MNNKTRQDTEGLMTQFYEKEKKDDIIGFIFTDIAKVDWAHHIPIICDFWESLLLESGTYSRNAMQVHYVLNRKVRLEEKHFQRWLHLFNETVDEMFEGEKASLAKTRARSIASLMQFKMQQESDGLNIRNKT